MPHLNVIRNLADAEKEAVGFLPEVAYYDAITRRRVIGMFTSSSEDATLVGFILFSGIYPNARIQQVVVAREHRRAGLASALIGKVVSTLEAGGYLRVTASVASDLAEAQAFYSKNGFLPYMQLKGGASRKREIVVRARDLANEHLFSVLERSRESSPATVDLGLRVRGASSAPLYVIDLNVLFDVTKNENRPRAAVAGQVIASALAHQFRLAVAPEFVVELQRASKNFSSDPVLSLAKQLQRLPVGDSAEESRLAKLIHKIVFVDASCPEAGSVQSLSDARHLAQAALARASGFLTSDRRILDARSRLLSEVGIDVATLEELALPLSRENEASEMMNISHADLAIKPATINVMLNYLQGQSVPDSLVQEFTGPTAGRLQVYSIDEAGEVVGIGAYLPPEAINSPARFLMHVRTDHVKSDILADGLLNFLSQEACVNGPVAIELPDVSGQTAVRRVAVLYGFVPTSADRTMTKIALGRPVTARNWSAVVRQIRRRTGVRLPETSPTDSDAQSGIVVYGPGGKQTIVGLHALEGALGPTLLTWPGRNGTILSIARHFADDLLGTGGQATLFGRPEAAFATRRTYLNSPRAAALLRPGLPILFYESQRSGGRGAIVALARVVDATIATKDRLPADIRRKSVVDDVDQLSASSEVLATTFDCIMRFPKPVSLQHLRSMKAVGTSNYQAATLVTGENLSLIINLGWSLG